MYSEEIRKYSEVQASHVKEFCFGTSFFSQKFSMYWDLRRKSTKELTFEDNDDDDDDNKDNNKKFLYILRFTQFKYTRDY